MKVLVLVRDPSHVWLVDKNDFHAHSGVEVRVHAAKTREQCYPLAGRVFDMVYFGTPGIPGEVKEYTKALVRSPL